MLKNYKRGGFTLIELLVVIAIIGILSSIVMASLNSARAKSRDAKRLSDIKSLQLALELYFDYNKAYPEGLTDGADGADESDLFPEYMSAKPKDPLGADYRYEACNSGEGYHLGASLEQLSSALNDDNGNDSNSNGNDGCGAPSTWGADDNSCFGSSQDGIQQGSKCYDVTD